MHAAGPVVAIAMDHVGQRCRKHRTVDNTDADKAKKVGHHCDGPRPDRERDGEKKEASSRVSPSSGRERPNNAEGWRDRRSISLSKSKARPCPRLELSPSRRPPVPSSFFRLGNELPLWGQQYKSCAPASHTRMCGVCRAPARVPAHDDAPLT